MAFRLRLSVPAATISFPLKTSVLVTKGISPQPQGIPVNIPLHIKCLRTEYGQRHIHIRHRHCPQSCGGNMCATDGKSMGNIHPPLFPSECPFGLDSSMFLSTFSSLEEFLSPVIAGSCSSE